MASYSDPKYGFVRRIVSPTKDDFGATGQCKDIISFKNKTKIIKYGVIPWTTLIRASTTASFVIETEEGTDLAATFTLSGGEQSLTAGDATGKTITATTVAAGRSVTFNVTEAGSTGSFYWFVDVADQFDAAAGDTGANK